MTTTLPDEFVCMNIQVDPLLLGSGPENADIRLVPNIPNQARKHIIGQDISHQLVDKVVIVCPIAVVSRPYS